VDEQTAQAQDAEALQRAATAVGVELEGASERQLALLRRSSFYAFALLGIRLREFWHALTGHVVAGDLHHNPKD
jgi:hypothetical protein